MFVALLSSVDDAVAYTGAKQVARTNMAAIRKAAAERRFMYIFIVERRFQLQVSVTFLCIFASQVGLDYESDLSAQISLSFLVLFEFASLVLITVPTIVGLR